MNVSSARLALVAAILLAVPAWAAPHAAKLPPDSPEPAIRAFYRAVLSGDVAAFHKVIVLDPLFEKSLRPGTPPLDKHLEFIDPPPADFPLRQTQPFRARGKAVGLDATGHYPVGTTTRYLASFPNSRAIITLVREADGWKVDLRSWR